MKTDGLIDIPVLHPPQRVNVEPADRTNILALSLDDNTLRTVRRVFGEVGWSVADYRTIEDALSHLRTAQVPVALLQAESESENGPNAIAKLRAVPSPPEVIVAGSDDACLEEILRLGGFDLLRRPLQKYDLLWAVATAWHQWMQKRERFAGGVRCSDA